MSISHNKHENCSIGQRGGTAMFAVGQILFRCTSTGKYTTSLGRWSWMEFSGQSEHTTRLITAYRPYWHNKKSKLITTWDEQSRYFCKRGIETDPKEIFNKDILATI